MTNLFTKKTQYFAQLPTSLIGVDYSYQKPLSMTHANNIARDYDPMGVGQIHVSKREDGTYYTFDGQHRLKAHTIKNIKVIDCIVYEGLTIEEEAKGYVFYNDTMKQSQLQRFKAELLAGVPSTIEIDTIVKSVGLKVDYDFSGEAIRAVGSIKSIYEKEGAERLENVLVLLKEVYGEGQSVYKAFVLNGLNSFFNEFEQSENYDMDWFKRNLKRQGLEKLLVESNALHSIRKSTKKEATKMALVELYNHNKRRDNRI